MTEDLLGDRTIECIDCQSPFTFTAGEQEYYRKKLIPHPKTGIPAAMHDPKRCTLCRRKKRAKFGAATGEQP